MAVDPLEAISPDSDGEQEVAEPADDAEDEFSAWIAETEDVAVAAGEVPVTTTTRQVADEDKGLLLVDEADPEEDDCALLGQLMGLGPRVTEAEQTVARSLLLGPRDPTKDATQANSEEPKAPAAESQAVTDEPEVELDDATVIARELEALERAKVIPADDQEVEVVLPDDPEVDAAAAACELDALESQATASLEALRTAAVDLEEEEEPQALESQASAGLEAMRTASVDLEEEEEPQVEISLDDLEGADGEEPEADIAASASVPQPETPPPAPATPPPAPQTPPGAKDSFEWEDNSVWDVDDLDAQADAFGALEAARPISDKVKEPRPQVKAIGIEKGGVVELDSDEELADTTTGETSEGLLSQVNSLLDDVRGRLKKAAPVAELEVPLASGAEDVDMPVEEDTTEPAATLQAPQRKRPAPPTKPMRASAKARSDGPVKEVPGGASDLLHVIVNCVEVGRSYARTVLCKDADDEDCFDWEGVRSCVQCFASEQQLKVVGVVPKDFEGEDSWSNQKCGLPDDIRELCESIEEAPSGSCSGHTKQLAHRRKCRFVDTEGREEDSLQLCYSYDSSLGTFSVIEGGPGQDNDD